MSKKCSGKRKFRLKPINRGLAYQYGRTIEINPVLKKYPRLYKQALEHEKRHLNAKSWIEDFYIDLGCFSQLWDKESWKFDLKNPKQSIQSSMPIWFDKSGFCYSSFLIGLWSAMLIIFGIVMLMILR